MKYNFAIVSYLDDQLTQKVREIQNELFELTGSRECLDNWDPHITIGAGVSIGESNLEQFYSDIELVVNISEPFTITLNDYEFTDHWPLADQFDATPYTVYLNVNKTDQLRKLVKDISDATGSYDKLFKGSFFPYTPHITVAFKDLTKEGYEKAKEFLNLGDFSYETIIDHVALTKGDKGTNWKEFKRFEF